ncbi:MAG: tRNA (adenosine(37)-N6)-threonylcarbamoyltransferase complex ATPase subunit type 1 TsaE [Algibacter sp.]|uniref:tRNA (adenosine(37)-N6)-threonylcarbamoyltransferase complex ATPase subunit type 1 TsaE n=1 Tax=Algibacter sp. TaxID=1872428 RepID=UPI00261BD69B|nr:tRNA (adenosine(37)-N6)-threonylcarbamoyltransferase complex ATPase subunit type 1 TsaE [Algibacter sp.]MDG1730879.1 tRNA (adenosine(37)-N6)-threonylcarbamoyltransferase complex ATPase subunit type 1 TsaE [Algibacter sp.]MDG2179381.1 tRNA (adenosine(37)-N6)-threonylcarbamoyltransferase complex ATPase subunit type 1 TsaE [Algibacter sp.]
MEICYGINEVEYVSKQLIKNLKTKTLLFYGDMGVGKTTLIKTLVKSLGSDDDVSSPTFSIVNEYELKGEKIYHFDLYRINNIEELYNFGIEDYLDSEHWKLIEWPEKIESILDDDYDKIEIKLDQKNNRILSLNKT